MTASRSFVAKIAALFLMAILLLGASVLVSQRASAQGATPQPGVGSNAAQDRGVYPNPSRAPEATEQQLLDVLRGGAMPPGPVTGTVYIPDQKAAVLVQPEGREWRDFRIFTARWIHVGLIALAVVGVLGMMIFVGVQRYRPDPQGRRIQRFRAFDRFLHWLTAVSFVILALTGLNVVFGRVTLQPLMSDAAFSTFSAWALNAHNFTGYAFIVGVLLMLLMWFGNNLFHAVDWVWIRRGGGMFGGDHPPAEKFNPGQKAIYWVSVLGGLAMGATGVAMMLPIAVLGVNEMQLVHGAHTIIAALMIAVIIGHIYLGAFGVQGSFGAMAHGDVDLNWARTHHSVWADEVMSGGARSRRVAPGRAEPAE